MIHEPCIWLPCVSFDHSHLRSLFAFSFLLSLSFTNFLQMLLDILSSFLFWLKQREFSLVWFLKIEFSLLTIAPSLMASSRFASRLSLKLSPLMPTMNTSCRAFSKSNSPSGRIFVFYKNKLLIFSQNFRKI